MARGIEKGTNVSDEKETTEGTYDPTGGVPSHPAAPGFGDKDADDAYDADDESGDDTGEIDVTPDDTEST